METKLELSSILQIDCQWQGLDFLKLWGTIDEHHSWACGEGNICTSTETLECLIEEGEDDTGEVKKTLAMIKKDLPDYNGTVIFYT